MPMKIDTIAELYQIISTGSENIKNRSRFIGLRKRGIHSLLSGNGFTKVAFDTRRIDQETEYNPRRGLQNYNRSQAFLSEEMAQKIKKLAVLRTVLADLKKDFGKEPEWQDSNARVLLSNIDKALRINEMDGDFSANQPAMASIGYIEELLHMRYRLTPDDLIRLGSEEIKKIIISKDEELIHKGIADVLNIMKASSPFPQHNISVDPEMIQKYYKDAFPVNYEITKQDVATEKYDNMIDKIIKNINNKEE